MSKCMCLPLMAFQLALVRDAVGCCRGSPGMGCAQDALWFAVIAASGSAASDNSPERKYQATALHRSNHMRLRA